MSVHTIPNGSTDELDNSYTVSNNTTLPSALTLISDFATVAGTTQGPGTLVLSLSATGITIAPPGGDPHFNILVDGVKEIGGTVTPDGTAQLNKTVTGLSHGSPHTVTVKWKDGGTTCTLLSTGNVVLSVIAEDWGLF